MPKLLLYTKLTEYSHASSTCIIYFFEKYQNLNYWWYFKVPESTSLWAMFGKT
jgi:hypothetical protein